MILRPASPGDPPRGYALIDAIGVTATGVAVALMNVTGIGGDAENFVEALQEGMKSETVTSNKGIVYDNTPSSNHSTTSGNPKTHPEWPHEHIWEGGSSPYGG